MDRGKVIIEKFFNVGTNGDITLREKDLGLQQENLILDAQSDDPETIFRYCPETFGYIGFGLRILIVMNPWDAKGILGIPKIKTRNNLVFSII